jgi:hypothetical protein
MSVAALLPLPRCARATLIQSALLALLTIVSSCSLEGTRLELENPSPTASGAASAGPADRPLPDHEPVPHSTVIVRWRDAADMNGAVLAASSGIKGELRNVSKNVATGRLVLVTAGLDSRKVERELERFTLAADGIGETSVQVGKLPIQSDAAPSFAALVAEIDGPKGPIRISSAPLYYRFEKGYSAAAVYNASSLASQPDWGLKTDNPMDVQGRIIEIDGRITDAALLAKHAADEALARKEGPRGFSALLRAPVDPETDKVVLPKKPIEMAPRSSANLHAPGEVPEIDFVFCSNWFVQYTDTGPAGEKEDFFATDEWAFHPPDTRPSTFTVPGGASSRKATLTLLDARG